MHPVKILATAVLSSTVFCAWVCAAEPATSPIHINHAGLKKLSWQLLCQTSTFHDLTTREIIDVLHTNGFHHIELSPSELPSPDREHIDAINAKLQEVHMDIVGYGVADFGHNGTDARNVFELGKNLKVKNIVATPAKDSLEMLDKLAAEYNINVAILNQPGSSQFADCDTLLQAIKERSNHIGVCADIAEWHRTGQDPVTCLRKLSGRIFEIHLQDNRNPAEAAVVADALKELAQQKFKGAFCVQTNPGNGQELIKNLGAVVNSFSDVVTELTATGK